MSNNKAAKQRCPWCEDTFEQYVAYHDEEWGVPIYNDRKQFEFLILESAQAGLSWSTVLKKREGYRQAFAEFDPQAVARFDQNKIAELLQNPEIIRNRQKVEAAVNNARRFLEIREEFGTFSDYIWSFVDGAPIQNEWKRMEQVPATSPESDRLATDMKNRGFKFIGSTILYAHMQATGMVNDHLVSCFRHPKITEMKP